MMTIDWIRHTSLEVSPAVAYGQTDMKVSATFETEAERVRRKLFGRSYDRVFTSPLSRARMLATYCGYPDAIEEPRVKEINLGEWEQRLWVDLMEGRTEEEWHQAFHTITPPGGESVQQLLARVRDFVEEVRVGRYARVAVFCHGGVINANRYFNGEVTLDNMFREILPYGSIYTTWHTHADQRAV